MHRGAESLQQACGRAIQSDAQEEPADTARIHMRQEIDRFFALFCAVFAHVDDCERAAMAVVQQLMRLTVKQGDRNIESL